MSACGRIQIVGERRVTHLRSSSTPLRPYPALLMTTLILYSLTALSTICCVSGDVTSRVIQFPPFCSISGYDCLAWDTFRAVATTPWPALSAVRAMLAPSPDDAPVMRKVKGDIFSYVENDFHTEGEKKALFI